jgi:DNA polymerase/3'-5' exonuclease PolX
MQNAQIARRLEEAAALLDPQGANEYRVRAYQRAAAALAGSCARRALAP